MSQYEFTGNPNQPFGDVSKRSPLPRTTAADTPLTDADRATWLADMQDTHRPNAKAAMGGSYWHD